MPDSVDFLASYRGDPEAGFENATNVMHYLLRQCFNIRSVTFPRLDPAQMVLNVYMWPDFMADRFRMFSERSAACYDWMTLATTLTQYIQLFDAPFYPDAVQACHQMILYRDPASWRPQDEPPRVESFIAAFRENIWQNGGRVGDYARYICSQLEPRVLDAPFGWRFSSNVAWSDNWSVFAANRPRRASNPPLQNLPRAPAANERLLESSSHRPNRAIRNGRSTRRNANATARTDSLEAAMQVVQMLQSPTGRDVSQEPAVQRLPARQETAPPAQLGMNFESGTYWRCADTTGQIREYAFTEMEDSHLYYTIENLVEHVNSYYQRYYRDSLNLRPLAAASGTTVPEYWLKTRPAFGGLVREAFRRQLTFPANTVAFITKNFSTGAPVRVATPWRSGVVQPEMETAKQHVEEFYTSQQASNAGQRAERPMS